MILVLFLGLVVGYIFIIPVRLVIQHPILTVKYAFVDLFKYFKYKKFNNYKTGKFDCYDARQGVVFGSGKTLSCVYQVRKDFYRYNNKPVYDFSRKKWVTQKVKILTNLTLNNLPYEKLTNLGQILAICERYLEFDKENDTLTCILVLIDECQNQLHCRSFKDNLSPLMLKSLTECRHYNMSIIYDCPRFSQVDALLRQCTSNNIKNRKIWRFQCQTIFDACDVENASNLGQIKPLGKAGFFIEDDLFAEYNTKEIIDNLVKAKDRGDFLTDEEILQLQCNQDKDNLAIGHKSSSYRRSLRKQ